MLPYATAGYPWPQRRMRSRRLDDRGKILDIGSTVTSGSGGKAWCTASASWSAAYSDYDVYVHSTSRATPRPQPPQATARQTTT